MRYLVIDNSNSRTKFSLANSDGLFGEIIRKNTSELNHEVVSDIKRDLPCNAVIVGSVVPEKAKLLADVFRGTPIHFIRHDSDHGIQINLDKPEQVGADRVANAVGVMSLYEAPAVVIDFGTAVTFDVVLEGGIYEGGVIMPGLGSMNEYLSKKTALLPKIDILEPVSVIGKTTVDAMLSGAVYGYRGMIRGVISEISRELGFSPLVISTGGDGKMIADGVEEVHHFSSQITLEGIRVIATRVF